MAEATSANERASENEGAADLSIDEVAAANLRIIRDTKRPYLDLCDEIERLRTTNRELQARFNQIDHQLHHIKQSNDAYYNAIRVTLRQQMDEYDARMKEENLLMSSKSRERHELAKALEAAIIAIIHIMLAKLCKLPRVDDTVTILQKLNGAISTKDEMYASNDTKLITLYRDNLRIQLPTYMLPKAPIKEASVLARAPV